MFDRISPTYDLLNRLLSAGTDRRWRARALALLARHAPPGPLLDSCAGTLDLAAGLERDLPGRAVVAADFAREMLARGRDKLSAHARLAVADAMQLPFADGAFAGVSCGFGMRNLADPRRGIAEAHRVLCEGGVFVVLEFFRPVTAFTRAFHAVYGALLLPLLGRLLSGDGDAYRYLSRSMRGFLARTEFEAALRDAGFRQVHAQELSFGIASLLWAVK
jgi:ubiquinone/menaquinone biosynthesis methyltransferase